MQLLFLNIIHDVMEMILESILDEKNLTSCTSSNCDMKSLETYSLGSMKDTPRFWMEERQ